MLKVLFSLTIGFTTLNALANDFGFAPISMNNDLELSAQHGAIRDSKQVSKKLGKTISIESYSDADKDGSRTFNVFGETHMAQVKVTAGKKKNGQWERIVTILTLTEIDGDEPAATTAN